MTSTGTPPDANVWMAGPVGLAHRPFNLRPTSGQPLVGADGLVLTADARIDNRPELIRVLKSSGQLQNGAPATDSELILAAYRRWGAAAPERIIGDFAFAIWDMHRQELFCARDPLGVKPLHYHRGGDLFCVASEAQQILRHPGVRWRLNERALADYLTQSHSDDESTMFVGVHRLPPGHRMRVSASGSAVEPYWVPDPEAKTRYRHRESYSEHFLQLFSRSVEDRLRTDAPVIGVAVSGGLDSSSVATIAQRLLGSRSASPQLLGYSYAFSPRYRCDERAYVEAIGTQADIDIDRIDVDLYGLCRDPRAFDPVLESPWLFWQSMDREVGRRLGGRGGTVLLDGWGADELLGGTPLLYLERLAHAPRAVLREVHEHSTGAAVPYPRMLYRHLLRPLLLRGKGRLTGSAHRPAPLPPWLTPEFAEVVRLGEGPAAASTRRRPGSPATRRRLELLFRSRLSRVIDRLDRVGAEAGIEVRHPFLDRRLVEFVLSVPPQEHWRAGVGKQMLRSAMTGILPEVVRRRRDKADYTRYHHVSFRDFVLDRLTPLLHEPLLAAYGIADPHLLQASLTEFRAGASGHLYSLSRAFEVELWLRAFGRRLEAS